MSALGKWAAGGATALGLCALAATASAEPLSLSGFWSGGGTLTLSSGNVEKVRCKATFRSSGNGASMNAICANATARVTQSADLTRVAGNRYIGEFTNREYGVSGTIRITVNGNNLNAAMSGGGGSASFSLSR